MVDGLLSGGCGGSDTSSQNFDCVVGDATNRIGTASQHLREPWKFCWSVRVPMKRPWRDSGISVVDDARQAPIGGPVFLALFEHTHSRIDIEPETTMTTKTRLDCM